MAPIPSASAAEGTEPCTVAPSLAADGDRMNESVAWQVSLGPRLPGSNASATLLASIEENHTAWSFQHDVHAWGSGNLTNLVGMHHPENGSDGTVLAFGAHYDTRDRAEREASEDDQNTPIPGANDGASGVAVLLELMRIVPELNLDHAVMVVFFDAEDQGPIAGMDGSRRWAANLSAAEIEAMQGFILLDMVGDADLNLARITTNTPSLASPIPELAAALGLVAGTEGCDGKAGADVYQHEETSGIIDDHCNVQQAGTTAAPLSCKASNSIVPAIVIIDHRYGEGADRLNDGHWHTLEDTPDKVSAESLERVARLVELGLRTGAWIEAVAPYDEPNGSTPPTTDGVDDEDTALAGPWFLIAVAWLSILALAGATIVALVMLRFLHHTTARPSAWTWDQ